MTKAEMMDDLGDVYTDRRLAPDLVEAALAQTTTDPVPILGQYLALTTGGSSGRRGVFVFDAWAAVQFMTSLTRALFVRVQAAGGPPPGGLTIAMIGAPSAVHATGSAAPWTAGGLLPFRFVGVPVTQPLDDIVDQLNAIDAPALAGYPTVLARLAAERLRGRLRIRPRTVSSTSETLDPLLRAAIAEAFEVPVVDMFGSTEGLVGISAPDDATLVFNSDVCITELVDEDHRPVPAGTPSAKVLVTNLSNRTQPLIRYELNDSFVRQPDAPDHGHLRATVQGRADELLRYAGVDVHPVVVRSVLVKEPAVLDYQVHQTARGIDVAALAGERLDEQRLRVRLVRALGDAGLRDPAVTVRSVATLKRHHESGKLQRFFLLS
jgi:phenylacetate-coenzyme A ligase PaaK-like adenylate-forming protein